MESTQNFTTDVVGVDDSSVFLVSVLPTVVAVLNAPMLFVSLISVVLALAISKTLWQTSMLHRNLKVMLLAQNAAIIGTQLMVSISAVNNYATGRYLSESGWVVLMGSFFAEFGVLTGHCLLGERILATVFADRYEKHWTSPVFSAAWGTILTIVCLVNSYMLCVEQSERVSKNFLTFIINLVVLVASFVEIFIMLKLGLYNASKYSLNAFYACRKHTLSERYQLSENVRTIRQLGPIFVAHFLLCLAVTLTFGVQEFFDLSFDASNASVIFLQYIGTWMCLAMLIALIQFHPVMRNKMRRLMRTIFLCGRRSRRIQEENNKNQQKFDDDDDDDNNNVLKLSPAQQSKNGGTPQSNGLTTQHYSIDNSSSTNTTTKVALAAAIHESELHFRMLQEQWA